MQKHIAQTQEISTTHLDTFMCNLFPLHIYVNLLTKLITNSQLGNYCLRYPCLEINIEFYRTNIIKKINSKGPKGFCCVVFFL